MPSTGRDVLAKTSFVLAVAVLFFAYGYGTRSFGWFPDGWIERVYHQARPFLTGAGDQAEYPQIYGRHGLTTYDADDVKHGQMLSSTTSGGTPVIRLVTTAGDTLHTWNLDPPRLFPNTFTSFFGLNNFSSLAVSHLDSSGSVLARVSHGPAAKLDACGNVIWRLPGEFHHMSSRAEDGSFWLIEESRGRPDYPGLRRLDQALRHSHDSVRYDRLVHVDSAGNVVRRIDLIDVLFKNDLQEHLARVLDWTNDLTHTNDVEPLPARLAEEYPEFEAGDLVVSLRTPSLVLVVDPRSLEVKWHSSQHWLRQHDPDFLGNGWIGVFDNRWDGTLRGEMLGGSRIVAVQPHTDSTAVLYPTEESQLFYAPIGGSWQLLDNGNILLTQGVFNRVSQVDRNGSTVWEWIIESGTAGTGIGLRGMRRLYDYSEETVDAWSCGPRA